MIHAAAQPSHDWRAADPRADIEVNAIGTKNLLEAARTHCLEAPLSYISSNNAYDDTPKQLSLVEHERRWEIDPTHTYAEGIREDMSI